jgi:ubiquitin C-terminal hydrolase
MDSLLPVAQAPIHRMSGGSYAPSMSGASMLPVVQGPPPPIAAMSGGASLLPHAPSVPIVGMHGGVHLLNMVSNKTTIQKKDEITKKSAAKATAATFGITTTFSKDYATLHGLSDVSNCNPIEENKTIKVCESLQPFVDRRVQALLKRVRFPSGNASVDMGCGTITRTGSTLQIRFHEKAITLLSGDLTGTFAAFHKDMPRHQPGPVNNSGGEGNLLSWMLGSPVIEKGTFQLVPFMESMNTKHGLSLEGFRTFLSYHKDGIQEKDVLRYAMELYGYWTGDVKNANDVYGLILPPNTAVRRVNSTFAVYSAGSVKTGVSWDPVWESHVGGFAVYESAPVASVALTASAAPIAPVAPVALAASATFSGKKMSAPIDVSEQQMIGGQPYTLRGMIQHDGGINGGHYTYLYHSLPENKWVQFSDSRITYPTVEDVKKEIRTGYIYLFEKKTHDGGPHKGVQNHGNSCWMNAALQMFYHLPEYRAYIEGFDATVSTLSPEIKSITLAIQQIFRKYSGGDQIIACSTEYQTLFKYTFPNQPIGSQQDAMEFITKVLLGIVENDPVNDLFTIQYETTLTCADKGTGPSIKTDPMNALSLVIPSRNSPLTLDDLLLTESTPEIMESGTKVDDKPCQTVTKTVKIQIPKNNQYVIIQLKRFI